MKKIIIIGNSIAAEIIYGYLKKDSRYKIIGFAVNKEFITQDKIFDYQLAPLENLGDYFDNKDCSAIIAMGYKNLNQNRRKVFEQVKNLGFQVETYIHQNTAIYSDQIGEGSIILPNSTLEPYSKVGSNSVVWANCVVGHHSIIENNCWIASGTVIAGQAVVKNNCFLGVNTTIANQVIVDEFNIVGANTAIIKDTKKNEVYLSRGGEKHRFNSDDYAKYFLK